MTERSLEVFKLLKIAETKFDYFILGISIALFSYLSQNLIVLSEMKDFFILCAIFLLFASIIAGIVRVHFANRILLHNFRKLYYQESKGKLTEALLGANSQINTNTGKIFDPIEISQKGGICCYHIRNWSLSLSFVLILLSKILLIIRLK